jgi:hypothetical protein
MSRDSSVGISTGYGMDGWGSILESGKRFFSILQRPDSIWGSPNLLSNTRIGAHSQGLKQPGREADHVLPSSVEIKNGGTIPQLSPTSSWRSA